MPECPYLQWPLFRRSVVAAFGRSLTALSILAHKIGRAVFYMLSRGTVFSMEKFLAA